MLQSVKDKAVKCRAFWSKYANTKVKCQVPKQETIQGGKSFRSFQALFLVGYRGPNSRSSICLVVKIKVAQRVFKKKDFNICSIIILFHAVLCDSRVFVWFHTENKLKSKVI